MINNKKKKNQKNVMAEHFYLNYLIIFKIILFKMIITYQAESYRKLWGESCGLLYWPTIPLVLCALCRQVACNYPSSTEHTDYISFIITPFYSEPQKLTRTPKLDY